MSIVSWGFNTTQRIRRLTVLTKSRYTHKSLIDILKFSFLVAITCNDTSVYYNSWLDYNEAEIAAITNKLFQQCNVTNKSKLRKDLVQNIYKETKKALIEWIELVCII